MGLFFRETTLYASLGSFVLIQSGRALHIRETTDAHIFSVSDGEAWTLG